MKGPRKAKSPNHPNANRVITVENEQGLAKIFALPSGPQSNEARIAATQMVPVEKNLKPGEKYCVMDSGAECNAADAKKAFGAYHVQHVKHKQQCVLANGTEITSNGICNVAALVEGEEPLILFEDLPVECPIISVRKVAKTENNANFKDGGGYIMNIATKKKLRFIEKSAIYLIEIQVVSPTDIEEHQGSGFSRPRSLILKFVL